MAPYSMLMLAGLVLGLVFWLRLSRRDASTVGLYVAALAGAFLGAKLAYLVCEGWQSWGAPDQWRQWATGKSILGALLGGFLAVEGVKRIAGIRTVTGDWFASFVPLTIALGRVGCLAQGCCPGRNFGGFIWPAVPVEFAFNILAAVVFWVLRKRQILTGQHFHLYMMAYGVFRFVHEPLRGTPKLAGNWSLYQVLALVLAGLGLWGFLERRKSQATPQPGRL